MNAVFGGSTVLNFYYAAYSDNKRGLNFMRNLNLAHILVIGGSWCSRCLLVKVGAYRYAYVVVSAHRCL